MKMIKMIKINRLIDPSTILFILFFITEYDFAIYLRSTQFEHIAIYESQFT